MKLAVIGTGYVGLVAGACFSETGNDVVCVDVDSERIRLLARGDIPIYEPGLHSMISNNLSQGRLRFTTDLKTAVQTSLLIFIAVGTPSKSDGSSDLSSIKQVCTQIGEAMNGYKIIVNKSTVPVGTADLVREIIASKTEFEFDVVSNPEFLKEGAAIADFMTPDRVVIGCSSTRAAEVMRDLYAPFLRTRDRIVVMDTRSAEMTKYASNCMLAARVSFINEIARICEIVGADVHLVRHGVGLDSRIGYSFLFPGIGYGGSCFPKDINALIRTAEENGFSPHLLRAIEEVNKNQKLVLARKVRDYFISRQSGTAALPLAGKRFAVWGLAFKAKTDDMREAPSCVIINHLLEWGGSVCAYDPAAMENARRVFEDRIKLVENNYEALEGADALLVLTEWNQFRNPDFERIRDTLNQPVIFDGRNLYNPRELREMGFDYFGIGR